MHEKVVEAMRRQTQSCILSFRRLDLSEVRHLLELELRHLDLLLEVLQSKISITSYLAGYHLLFSGEESYSWYARELLFLEKAQIDIDTVSIAEEKLCVVNVLQIFSDNIKKHIADENYEVIHEEADFQHNVPLLLSLKKENVVNVTEYAKCYLSVLCPSFKRRWPKEVTKPYENAWEQMSKQFLGKSFNKLVCSYSLNRFLSKVKGIFRKS